MSATAPRARALAARLKEARSSRNFTVRALAERLHISYGVVSNWENGHAIPSIEQVSAYITALGVSAEERDEVLDIARGAHSPDWLTVGIKGLPAQLTCVMELERSAYHITEWIPFAVPGLLQTPDYARALKKSWGSMSEDDLDVRLMLQAGRQRLIKRAGDPIQLDAYIGEGALHTQVGTPDIMRRQLGELMTWVSSTNVAIRVIPLGGKYHPGLAGPFVLYRFREASPVVHFEHHSSGAFVHDKHDVSEYESVAAFFDRIALPPEESSSLILKVANKIGELNQ